MSLPSNTMRPAVGSCRRVDQPRQRGLAAAGLADQADRLAAARPRRSTPSTARRTRCGRRSSSRGSRKVLDQTAHFQHGARSAVRATAGGGALRGCGGCRWTAVLCHPAARGAVLADRQQVRVLDALRIANGQRARKRQPAGHALGSGGGPSMVTSRRSASSPVEPRRGMQQRPGVGMARIGQQILCRTFLHHLAGIHHQHARADVGDHAEIVADQDHRGVEIGVQFASRSRICAWIFTSSAVVGRRRSGARAHWKIHGGRRPLPHAGRERQ